MDSISAGNDSASNSVNMTVSGNESVPAKTKLSSDAWTIFSNLPEEIVNGKKIHKAKCFMCNVKLVCHGNSGASNLSRHIKSHINAQANTSDLRNQMMLGKDKNGMVSNYQFDNDKARTEIINFIVRVELPFSFVDTHDFAGMIQRAFAPQFKKFSRQSCKRDVMKRFDACKSDLVTYFESFKGKVCFTSDMWSSRQKMGYMSLTAHWIDDEWCMQKRILSFKMVEYPHTGECLASHIYQEFIAWRLHDKALSITLDNASNNDVLVAQLGNHLMLPSIAKNIFHVRCTCHILNLIVHDGLSVLSPSIEKITAIVRSMNSSIKRHELWVSCCAELNLSKKNIDNDVPHRWNSTYEMLKVAVKYKSAIHRYCLRINESRNSSLDTPHEHDWVVASLCMSFLAVFYNTTKVCSGVYSPTANKVINSLVDIHAHFKAYQPLTAFKSVLDAMKLKFDKYWAEFPIIFCLATVMDPRFKLLAIETWLKSYDIPAYDVDSKLNHVKSVLNQVYDTYKRKFQAAPPVPTTTGPVSSAAVFDSDIIDINIPVVQSVSMSNLKRARISNCVSSSDLQIYLDHDILDVDEDASFNILGWWKMNSSMYPILSMMAKDILSIPASTVASESAFSTGGRIISEKRASLSPNTIEALICLKDWSLAASRQQEAALEEAIAEELMNIQCSRPDWLQDEDLVEISEEIEIESATPASEKDTS